MNHHTLLKTTTSTSMIAVLLTITTGCVTAPGYNAYGDLYEDIYKDSKVYKSTRRPSTPLIKSFISLLSNKGLRIKSAIWVIESNTKKVTVK